VTAWNVIGAVSAAVAAVAACAALVFGWLATKEGRRTLAEAVIARNEAQRERQRWRYERIPALNEEIFTRALDLHNSQIVAVTPQLRRELNKMKALVVGLEKVLPHACAAPDEVTNGGVVRETGEGRYDIRLAIAALDEASA
jgi:formyltetrahydrofolate synthetase